MGPFLRVGAAGAISLLCAAAVGCGGAAGSHAVSTDAGVTDGPPAGDLIPVDPALCPGYRFGKSFIVNSIGFLPTGDGYDLNGDGIPDNALGVLARSANPDWQGAIKSANLLIAFDVTNWNGTPTDQTGLGIASYIAIDPTNFLGPDFSILYAGSYHFTVDTSQFDVGCKPTTLMDQAVLHGGVISGASARWPLEWWGARDTVEFDRMHIDITPNADGTKADVRAGGVWSICGLSHYTPYGDGGATLLDLLVNLFKIQPDIALGHAGAVDQLVGDGRTIGSCVTSDGTSLPGPACVCDARITDGYSAGFYATMVHAFIDGIQKSH